MTSVISSSVKRNTCDVKYVRGADMRNQFRFGTTKAVGLAGDPDDEVQTAQRFCLNLPGAETTSGLI